MSIVALFITDQLMRYNLSTVKQTLVLSAENLIKENMLQDGDVITNRFDIQRSLNNTALPEGYEISVIDLNTNLIAASTNNNLSRDFNDDYSLKYAPDVFDEEVLLSTESKDRVEKIILDNIEKSRRSLNIAMRYDNADKSRGFIIYLRASLADIDSNMNRVKIIFFNATLIALLVTIVLGYFISFSITVPINDLKDKAVKMSDGDFSQRAEIKSSDEIGELAGAFNFLTERLSSTLIEISSEQNKLKAIIEHMDDGLLAVDKNEKIVHYNNAAVKLLAAADIGEKSTFNEIFKPDLEEINFKKITECAKNGKTTAFTISRKDRILKVSPAFYSDDSHTIEGYAVLFQDITEHERLDNMRKEFVANVSHELKTPITTIKSYAETLLDSNLEDRDLIFKFISVINKESDRMTALIRDLLQLSHIDFKKEKWNYENTDIKFIINETSEKLKMFAEEKKQQISTLLPEYPLSAYVDRSKTEQVITNILSNSIKYTQNGGHIEIKAEKMGSNILIKIKDDGIGIPEKDIPHIFERFYRVDKGRSRAQGGTGLGLSIAQNIINEHKGEIKVNSKLGIGTEFIISIPENYKKI